MRFLNIRILKTTFKYKIKKVISNLVNNRNKQKLKGLKSPLDPSNQVKSHVDIWNLTKRGSFQWNQELKIMILKVTLSRATMNL